ncbi:alpha/beta fold hydrolase [Aquisalimonas sp. 2447]|uniref:alpha/beta fold hydrolase n=1 Tax=Aquisalimonas sp. 2447 TaxID=2740807 RepID=UPI0014327373|nr:alpha/beta fold hydrolase [Aquisalimonas sp. 2447]QIT54159.1 alpha/beta fold hydrolase [Aquisalimonas sp. 2447]
MTEPHRPSPDATGGGPALPQQPVSVAPREEIAGRSPWRLYRYTESSADGPPVCIVYSLINRPTLLDLDARHSMVRRLIEQGRDVYLLCWDDPAPWQRLLGLADYALRFPRQALDALCRYRGVDNVDVLGICQGGLLALIHATVFPARIRRLVLLATPVDTQRGEHRLGRLLRAAAPVSQSRNVSGTELAAAFASLRLTDLAVRRYRPGADTPEEARQRWQRMEAWMYDCPDQPARLVQETVHWLYRENRLARGVLDLGGHRVRLDALRTPVLNVAAYRDHLVPAESALALQEWLPAGVVTSRLEPGGHLGLFVSRRSQRTLAPAIGSWLDTSGEVASW